MKIYSIVISFAAETDMMDLALFLRSVMSVEKAWKYLQPCVKKSCHCLSLQICIIPITMLISVNIILVLAGWCPTTSDGCMFSIKRKIPL